MTTGFVYKRTEPGLWTVGHYDPAGDWEPESDHGSRDDAARRVHWLNGGDPHSEPRLAVPLTGAAGQNAATRRRGDDPED